MLQDVKEQTTNQNKSIAGFMGIEVLSDWDDPDALSKINWNRMLPAQLKYHTSWDWLMPVVQKIFKIDTGFPDSYSLWVCDSLATADIKQVYGSVINFIEWFNTLDTHQITSI